MSAVARAYLIAALDVMQQHALNRARLNWSFLRQRAMQEAAGAVRPSDVYPVIRLTLGNLDDNFHSGLFAPGATASEGVSAKVSSGRMLAHSIAYLTLPSHAGSDPEASYITAAEAAIREGESHHACGWIVDLRGNGGGDVWPMLIGVQPLLGSGTVGYFVAPSGTREVVSLDPDVARDGAEVQARAVTPNHDDLSPMPVAVLTGPSTASSGEFIAIAFRGRPNTLSVGMPTSGRPTANADYRLSDGAILNLTDAQDADRTGHVYPDAPIPPDKIVTTGALTQFGDPADPVVQAAESWLTSQHHCR